MKGDSSPAGVSDGPLRVLSAGSQPTESETRDTEHSPVDALQWAMKQRITQPETYWLGSDGNNYGKQVRGMSCVIETVACAAPRRTIQSQVSGNRA